MPKVSVIMGIYNTADEPMVAAAIGSILSQTLTDWELVICDDGSTDGTFPLLQRLTRGEDRVVLLQNQRNSGLAAALNHCLSVARGEYVARMDADDISEPDRLQKEADFLDSHPEYAVVGSAASLFDDGGVWGSRAVKTRPEKRDFLFGTQHLHATIMMRREIYQAMGGYRVKKETLRAEDYDLFMRLYAAGHRGYNLEEELYRIREDKNAYRRRAYRFRFGEAKVRFHGFCQLGLMPLGMVYVAKPLVVGLIPQRLLKILRNDQNKGK